MSDYDADTFYAIINGDQDLPFKEQTLSEFKAHVKRDFVNLQYVPKYFETLIIALNRSGSDHLELRSLAFSTICHLIKRVCVQDGTVLRHCYKEVVPQLIVRLSNGKIVSTARKLLVGYWHCCPNEVESVIKEFGLKNNDFTIVDNCLSFLIFIVQERQQNLMFKTFTSIVVSFLKSDVPSSTQLLAQKLLIKFFQNSTSKTAKLDLINEFMKQAINKNIVHIILMDIDPNLINEFNQLAYNQASNPDDLNSKFLNAGSVKISAPNYHSLNKTKSTQGLRPRQGFEKLSQKALEPDQNSEAFLNLSSFKPHQNGKKNAELELFLNTIPGYHLESIKGMRIPDVASLRDVVEEMLPAFLGKETEFNWTLRERHIIHLRSIVRGNAPMDFPESLSQSLRTLSDAITKAVGSLRTSLSSNGCQLVREMAIFCGETILDNVTIDVCATVLLKLSSSAKRIASTNAFVAFSGLIANVPFYIRVFNQIISASQDKNFQPRLYSSTWLQIYIMKNHNYLQLANSGIPLEQLERSILKCLNDPNATVRESMRSTFWCFYKYWPSIAEKSLSKLDLTTKKALDRSKPLNISTSAEEPLRSPKKRQSIRDLIVAKNRSTTSSNVLPHQNKVLAASRLPSSGNGDIGKPVRVQTAHRAKRIPSSKTSSLAAAGVASRSRSEELGSFNSKNGSDFSTRDIFQRAPSITSPEPMSVKQSSPMVEDVASEILSKPDEQQQEDMIIKLLRSDSIEMKSEAISLLKYAFLSNEDIAPEIDEMLNSLSMNDPKLLKPLFDLELLQDTSKHLSPDNLIRSFIICHITDEFEFDISIDGTLTDALVRTMSVDGLYASCANLINTLNNVSLVVNGKLTLQLIKYKGPNFKFLTLLLVKILENFPISDISYLKVSNVLFQSLDFFMTSEDARDLANYKTLLLSLYEINPLLFKKSLGAHGESVTETVRSIMDLDISKVTHLEEEDANMVDSEHNSLYEMTMINPKAKLNNSQPQPFNIDNSMNNLTMVMPKFVKPRRSSIKENIAEDEEDDDSIFHHHGLNFQEAEKETYEPKIESHDEEKVASNFGDHKMDRDVEKEDKMTGDVEETNKQCENENTVHGNMIDEDVEMGLTRVDGLTNYETHKQVQDGKNPNRVDSTTVVIPVQQLEQVGSGAYSEGEEEGDLNGHSSPSSSRELITQIENVNITSPVTANSAESELDNMINKLDPLCGLTAEKSFNIYQDEKDIEDFLQITPSVSFDDQCDTWYSFQLQKHSSIDLKFPIKKTFVEELKSKCLFHNSSADEWLLFMIVIFQSPIMIMQMDELLQLIDLLEPESKEFINGIGILIHCLKNQIELDTDHLEAFWDIVIFKVSKYCEYFANEVWFAMLDLIHELINRNYEFPLNGIKFPLDDDNERLVAISAIKGVVDQYLNELTEIQVQDVAKLCRSLLNDTEVAVRRCVICILATLSQLDDINKYLVYDESVKNLSNLQYKLVEQYGMMSS